MKKLILAATIVCVAAFAQASAVTWGLSSTATLDTELFAAGTAYFFADATIARPTFSTAAGATEWYNANKDSLASKAFFTGEVTDGASYNQIQYDEAVGRKAYWLLIVNDDATELAISTSVKSISITTATTSATATWTAGTQTASYALSSSPTPEPTSGMLLLLGFAGLALRRRRA